MQIVGQGLRHLAAASLVVLASCGPTAVPPSSTPPSTTPRPSGAASIEPASIEPTAPIRFEQVETPDGLAINALVAITDGFLAAGCRLRTTLPSSSACSEAVVLTSADGRTWTEATVDEAADASIAAVADTPLGLLAVGAVLPNQPDARGTRAVWRSADGTRWQPFEIPGSASIVFGRITSLDERIVLFGADTAFDLAVESEAWATTDGVAWTMGRAPVSAKVVADPGFVAVGDECVDVCPPESPLLVRRSIDGLEWSEGDPDPAFDGAFLSAPLAAWNGRAIAAGTIDNESPRAAVWLDAGSGWQRTELPGSAGYTPNLIVGRPTSVFVIARTDAGPGGFRGWSSSVGIDWEQTVIEDLPNGFLTAAAGRDPIVAVVDRGTIWVSIP